MSRKAPKKFVQQSSTPKVTAEEERQARRDINGIVVGLLVIMVVTVLIYKFLLG